MANSKTIKIKERSLIEWVIIVILLLLILFLALAPHYGWWPYSKAKNLGSAFYSGISATNNPAGSGSTASTSGSSGSGSSSSGSSGTGSSGSGSSSSSSGGSGSSTSPILTFAAGVNNGDTKQDVSGQASGLNEHCSILVTSSTAGKQEVCTYTEGDKVVTVTYLNDHVVSASRSGF